jgi:hypothetical protein
LLKRNSFASRRLVRSGRRLELEHNDWFALTAVVTCGDVETVSSLAVCPDVNLGTAKSRTWPSPIQAAFNAEAIEVASFLLSYLRIPATLPCLETAIAHRNEALVRLTLVTTTHSIARISNEITHATILEAAEAGLVNICDMMMDAFPRLRHCFAQDAPGLDQIEFVLVAAASHGYTALVLNVMAKRIVNPVQQQRQHRDLHPIIIDDSRVITVALEEGYTQLAEAVLASPYVQLDMDMWRMLWQNVIRLPLIPEAYLVLARGQEPEVVQWMFERAIAKGSSSAFDALLAEAETAAKIDVSEAFQTACCWDEDDFAHQLFKHDRFDFAQEWQYAVQVRQEQIILQLLRLATEDQLAAAVPNPADLLVQLIDQGLFDLARTIGATAVLNQRAIQTLAVRCKAMIQQSDNIDAVEAFVGGLGIEPAWNNNALVRAAFRQGRVAVLRFLLGQSAGCRTAVLRYNWLRAAVNREDVQLVAAIAEYEERPAILSDCFAMACAFDSVALAQAARTARTDVNADGGLALRIAVLNGRRQMVAYLVEEAGADVAANRNIAFYYAVRFNQPELVEYLGGRPEVDPNDKRERAFKLAIRKRRFGLIRLMLAIPRFAPSLELRQKAARMARQTRENALASELDQFNRPALPIQ